jgi:hypothetical protein
MNNKLNTSPENLRVAQSLLEGMSKQSKLKTLDLEELTENARKGMSETFGKADAIFESLMKQVEEFQKTLDNDEELIALLTSFGEKTIIKIANISFRHPYMIIFDGIDEEDSKVQLIQHTSQLKVLFKVVRVENNAAKPRRIIGFGIKS